MGKYNNINDLDRNTSYRINTTDTDFKAEVIGANLIEKGYDPQQIMIIREGASKRGFAKDIEEIKLEFNEHDLKDYLYIRANKEGIYDILPEGIFHQPVHRKFNKDKEEELEEIRVHREQEFFARRFFRLFETEIDHTSILAHLYEIRFDKKISNRNFIDIFLPYWPLLRLLELEQAVLFMHTIPVLYTIKDNLEEIEKSLSLILDVPVWIRKILLPAKKVNNRFESKLAKCTLGTDFVLGKTFNDGEYDLKMIIGPVSSRKMEYFLKTDAGKITLDCLCDIFLPGETFIEREFNISSDDSAFILSNESTNTYLGINTFI